ncbi:MAG: ATP-dependent helicase HrpB, partial [Actinomycetota bacterium]
MTAQPVDLSALDRLGLPVEEAVPAVRSALADDGTAVLQAEPGAGKTTAVPLRLLDEPWLADRRILVLEPRRVAARAAARRMSALVGDRVGGLVGVRTRDDTRVGPDTRIEVITEGVLTRRIQHEPELDDVGAVVFDEFHERSLTVDLGLALALDVRGALRPDLRLLVMSATIDVDRVAGLLGGDGGPAPVARAPGRLHPITVAWRPRAARDPLAPAVADAVRAVLAEREGDVLAFLPGAAEIRRSARLLSGARDAAGRAVAIRPLYGALPAAEQDLALTAEPDRTRVVLATDIAETSLTVDGVRSVVDSGLTRAPRFDPGSGMTRLTTLSISRASAEQRAGRSGRLAPGHVVRLWSEAEHAGRRTHTDPEIVAVDLASFVLDAAVWGERDPTRLALLDPPPAPALDEARSLLRQLGALGDDGVPTAAGRRMAELPVHPRLGALLETARARDQGWTACVIAAVLEERDVLRGRIDERPVDLDVRLALVDDPRRPDPRAD